VTDRNDNSGAFAVISLLLVFPLAAWKGWVLVRIWAWFVVPLGVPALTVWHAAGLSLLVGWLADSSAYFANTSEDKRSRAEKFVTSVTLSVLTPLLTWGMAAVFHSWM
jgi:hypothetical protein